VWNYYPDAEIFERIGVGEGSQESEDKKNR
jgi:hypothetical protein